MDFAGQALAERLSTILIAASAAVAFPVGYLAGDFSLMMKVFGLGLGLTLALVLPAWPIFCRDPVDWLPPKEGAEGDKPAEPEPKRKSLGNLWGLL